MRYRLPIITLLLSCLLLAANAGIAGEMPTNASDFQMNKEVTVTLQNSCTHDVRYSIKGGSTGNGTVSKKGKERIKVVAGAKLYIDAEFFMEIEATDDGETYVVCR